MLPASNRGTGQNVGFPDTCNTPTSYGTTPIPYTNTASHGSTSSSAQTVMISGMNALNQASSISTTSGDEAGSAGPTKGVGAFSLGNVIVYLEGTPAVTLASLSTGNNMVNTVGAVSVPSVTNVFFTDASFIEASRRAERLERYSSSDTSHLRIDRFTLDLATRVESMVDPTTELLTLDLRGCPGGELDSAIRLAELFVPQGTSLGYMLEADGDERPLRARRKNASLRDVPLRLLVDRMTASAAEIFAAMMLEAKRAAIVGERTYGKGLAYAMRTVGFAVEARPEATYVSASGIALQGAGVEPHVIIELY